MKGAARTLGTAVFFAVMFLGGITFACPDHAVAAEEEILSGYCGADSEKGHNGKNITWTLNKKTKELRLSGSGEMEDFFPYDTLDEYEASHAAPIRRAPWAEYRYEFDSVVVEKGITTIGNHAFAFLNAKEISLPEGLEYIGNSFEHSDFEKIVIPDSVKQIGTFGCSAFFKCHMKELVLGKNITELDSGTFYDCYNLQYITIRGEITSFIDCKEWAPFHIDSQYKERTPKTYIFAGEGNEALKNLDWSVSHRKVHFVQSGMEITTQPEDSVKQSTPGSVLAKGRLKPGVVGGEADIEGTWEYEEAGNTLPEEEGVYPYKVVFTPDSPYFQSVSCYLNVTVKKVDFRLSDAPEPIYAFMLTYDPDQTLEDLSACMSCQSDVSWKWVYPDTVPQAGSHYYTVEAWYTKYGLKYNHAFVQILLTLNTVAPSDGMIQENLPSVQGVYGETLGDLPLPDEWTWKNPDEAVAVTNSGYQAVYTPADSNYHAVEVTVPVSVSPAKYRLKNLPSILFLDDHKDNAMYYPDRTLAKSSIITNSTDENIGYWKWKTDTAGIVPEYQDSYPIEFVVTNESYTVSDSDRYAELVPITHKNSYPKAAKTSCDITLSWQELQQLEAGTCEDMTGIRERFSLGNEWQLFSDDAPSVLQEMYNEAKKNGCMYSQTRMLIPGTKNYAEYVENFKVNFSFDESTLTAPELEEKYRTVNSDTQLLAIPLPDGWEWKDKYQVLSENGNTAAAICRYSFLGTSNAATRTVTFQIRSTSSAAPSAVPTAAPKMTPSPKVTATPAVPSASAPAATKTPVPAGETATAPEPDVVPTAAPTADADRNEQETAGLPSLDVFSVTVSVGASETVHVLNFDRSVIWLSADDSVAAVCDGAITGKKNGSTVIFAICDGYALVCGVSVTGTGNETGSEQAAGLTDGIEAAVPTPAPSETAAEKDAVQTPSDVSGTVSEITSETISEISETAAEPMKLNKTKLTIKRKKTKRLKVIHLPKGQKVSWIVKNKKIATVTAKGKVKAKKKGKTVVYAIAGSRVMKCRIVVKK